MNNGSNGNGGAGKRGLPMVEDPVDGLAPLGELPGSERAFLTDGELQVPVRRITVGAGEAPIDVYDPAGPRNVDPARRPAQAAAALDRPPVGARRHQLQPDALRPAAAS